MPEHAADPLGTAGAATVECPAPGGLLVPAVPSWPSPHAEGPNKLANLPPHHLARWSGGACRALAARRWHASTGLVYAAARPLAPVLDLPRGAGPLDVLLSARKRG